ncbi:MAG: spore photoproduct lyase family protein [Actinomycetota bacterium]|nr:spore photoproduct lyase family protein [Actinomycetota bacterium]
MPENRHTAAGSLLKVEKIYHEPDVAAYERGREVLERFPDAERVEVASHWNIPELHGDEGSVGEWNRTKKTVLVLGSKKGLQVRPFYRSCDFIAPSQANGCAMACSYCYVARRKGYANPITTFVNIEGIMGAVERHAAKQGMKFEGTQADLSLWVYELGTNSDLSVDAAVSDNVRDLVGLFRELPNAKATFATKFVNREMLDYDPRGKTRLRFSLMPPETSKLVDVRTSPVGERIRAMDDFVEAGYEVNVNFGPVIVKDGWQQDYVELFSQIDDALSPAAKAQLAAETIFLTHTRELHEVNLRWHPKGEDLLWRPDLQEHKTSQASGEEVLRYERKLKRGLVAEFEDLLAEHLPYCRVRYAF